MATPSTSVTAQQRTNWSWWIMLSGLLLCVFFAFRPGLSGPMLLDDFHNLTPLSDYVDGQRTAANVIFGNTSGMLRRPLSMATFVLNADISGDSVAGLKAGNLLLHLITTIIVALLLRRLLFRTPPLSQHANALALLLAAIWAIHPLQAGAVLYLIQRMALLSGMFSFAALLAYVTGRERLEANRQHGLTLLFCIFPVLVALGMASKENAVLTPLLACVLEWIFFARTAEKRPKPARLWLKVFVLLPVALGFALLIALHGRLLNYSGRDFTLLQRVLTESRILWEYVAAWCYPVGPRLALFQDNHALSEGLLSPATTILSLCAWGAILAAALLARLRYPLFSAGVLFFVVGNLLESTILPLELYFEHRNYLPGLGVILAITGICQAGNDKLRNKNFITARTYSLLLFAIPAAYGLATFSRSTIWGNETLFWAVQERLNPESPRMRSELFLKAIQAKNLPLALHQADLLELTTQHEDRAQVPLLRLLAYCMANDEAPASRFSELAARANGPITLYDRIAWQELVTRIEAGTCPTFNTSSLIDIGRSWLKQAGNPTSRETWQSRFYLGLLLASQQHYAEAELDVRRAWEDSDQRPEPGILLYQLNGTLHRPQAQHAVLKSLEKYTGHGDAYIDNAVREFTKTANPLGVSSPKPITANKAAQQ